MTTPRGPAPLLVRVDGREVAVWPRRSEKAARVRLVVRPGPRVELTLPVGASLDAAEVFLRDNLVWLGRALGRARPAQNSLCRHLAEFPSLTVDDRWADVELLASGRAGHRMLDGDRVSLSYPEADPEGGLRRAVRGLAGESLRLATERLSRRVGVGVAEVSVRDQSTRWGSCSSGGALSLNWRLVLLPPAIHDHVILHELAHRRHMDHSDRFWSQLEAWDPDWRRHDRELTRTWARLMDLGR
jgi:predicted metal-dependent hydrolase